MSIHGGRRGAPSQQFKIMGNRRVGKTPSLSIPETKFTQINVDRAIQPRFSILWVQMTSLLTGGPRNIVFRKGILTNPETGPEDRMGLACRLCEMIGRLRTIVRGVCRQFKVGQGDSGVQWNKICYDQEGCVYHRSTVVATLCSPDCNSALKWNGRSLE